MRPVEKGLHGASNGGQWGVLSEHEERAQGEPCHGFAFIVATRDELSGE